MEQEKNENKQESLDLDGIMKMASNLMKNNQISDVLGSLNKESSEESETSLTDILGDLSLSEVEPINSGELFQEMYKLNNQVQELKKQMKEVREQYTNMMKLLK
ncbi:hypothetical protein [Halobacillus seohaensis]|uniref:Uncharacterized protein n=1 Tax=Halobacillus seohaensis TaxID=447421 RepID=A0ABW2ESV6_9BACI